MTQFQASLIADGDPKPLPTTVELTQGKLSIASNGQEIGDWRVEELDFEPIAGGFKVTLDGEVAVLKMPESEQFGAALDELNGTKATRGKRAESQRKEKPSRAERKAAKAATATKERVEARREPDPKPKAEPSDGFMLRLDGWLEIASQKWNRYLPDWMFTRGGLVVALAFLVVVVVFRTIFSYLFLIVAAVGLITSAIALLDQVIATKIFRGGLTPIHGLLGSLGLVLLSLLLGASAL